MANTSKLDPHIQDFLDKINNASHTHSPTIDIAAGREAYLMMALTQAGWPLRLARVEDICIPSSKDGFQIPVRIYTPVLGQKLPALIYFHGGGWQRGDLATHDSICRHFAKFAGCIVVSVQWRLAPEHRFPIGQDDCMATYKWLTENGKNYSIDTARLAVGGDSAGGNIAAAIAQRLRQTDLVKPVFQLLLYPALDLSCSTWSYEKFAEGYFLSTERVKYYVNGYINSPDEVNNPMVSPVRQKDLSGLPRTHIVTAGYDPLRGEGEAYAQQLKEAGIPVSCKCYEEMVHAFLHMNHTVPAAEKALQEISSVIKDALQ